MNKGNNIEGNNIVNNKMKNIKKSNNLLITTLLLILYVFWISQNLNIQGIFVDEEKQQINQIILLIDETEHNMKKLKNYLNKNIFLILWKKMRNLKKNIIKVRCKEKKIKELEEDFLYLQNTNNNLKEIIDIYLEK